MRRCIQIAAEVDPDNIVTTRGKLTHKLSQILPDNKTVYDWSLSLPHDPSGYPLFSEMESTVEPVEVWERTVSEKCTDRLVVRKRGLDLMIKNGTQEKRRYKDLEQLSNNVLPLWADNFSIKKFSNIALIYKNLISKETFPTLITTAGEIPIAKILKFIHGYWMPSGKKLVPPYEHTVTFMVEEHKSQEGSWIATAGTKLESRKVESDAAQLMLTFYSEIRALQDSDKQELTWKNDGVRNLLSALHSVITDLFYTAFTDEAISSFGAPSED